MDDFKVALLIMAHKNVEQTFRLIQRLKTDKSDIFIHCDRRWDEGFDYFNKIDYCYCCENRYYSNLDEWSLVEAELELLKYARNKDNYNYYILLSAQDYPLISIEKIIEELKNVYPKPFIDCTPWDLNNWVKLKFQSNIYFFKVSRYINKKVNQSYIRKSLKVIPFLIFKLIDLFSNPYKRLMKENVRLYGGSAWWILPDGIIDFILSEIEKDEDYIRELSRTITPEETFFQIMSMRSPLKDMVTVNHKDMVLQNCKTYAYFFSATKKFMGHPYTFQKNEEDRKILWEKRDSFYFARKFDIDIDRTILDYIDKYMLK